MELLQELIAFALRASIFSTVLAVGLNAGVEDATYVLRRPLLLLRSLLAIAVIVPAFAALLVAVLPLEPVVKIGIVLMAVSPLAPLVPAKEIRAGARKSYVDGLIVAIAVLSIMLVPATVALLAKAFDKHYAIAPAAVARLMVISLLAPFAIGMTVRALWPALAKRAAPLVGKLATVVLTVSVLPLMFHVAPIIWHLVGDGTIIAIATVVAVGMAGGHFLGGPDPHDRVALALSSGTRHPGMALLIGHAGSSEPGILAAILLFAAVAMLAAIPYIRWVKRRLLAAQ
jgi:BASS family bile acid:Na+ symporter